MTTNELIKENKMHIITKNQYEYLLHNWKTSIANGYEPEAWEHVIYNVLREKPAGRGFSKKTKNIQGNDPWYRLHQALWTVKFNISTMRQKPMTSFMGVELPKNFESLLKHDD